MASAPPYQRQVRPGTPDIGMVSADAFGAGVGRGLDYAGNEIERRIDLEKKRREDEATADAAVKAAQLRVETDQDVIDARTNAGPAAEGHSAAVTARYKERSDALLGGISDPRVRRRMQVQLAQQGAELQGREYAFEQGARVNKMVTDTGTAIDLAANRVRGKADPAVMGEEIDALDETIGAMSVPDDVKQRLLKDGRARITRSYLEGTTARDPKAAAALLDSGAFDSFLSPEQLDSLRSEAGVEVRRQDAQAAQTLALEKADARQRINVFQKKLADGVPVPDAQIAEAQDLATKYGFEGEVYDLGKARVINNVNRIFQGATPAQIDAEIKRYDGVIAAAGDKAAPADVIAREQLQKLLPARTAELQTDPLGYGARNGMTIAPINWNDPASLDKRAAQARAITAQTGAPLRLLTDEEAAIFANQLRGGAGNRIEVAEQLGRFGARDGMIAARQVAPNDLVLQRVVTLPRQYRALALGGPDARKANPALVPQKESGEAFQEIASAAMRNLPSDFSVATIETARNIYASLAAANGASEFNETTFAASINMALGGDRKDGVWRGGIGEYNRRPMLLPVRMTQAEFDRRLSRLGGDLPKGAANGAPVYADGSAVFSGQIRERFTPVAVGDGLYRFARPDGSVLMKKGGGPWVLDIRKVGE